MVLWWRWKLGTAMRSLQLVFLSVFALIGVAASEAGAVTVFIDGTVSGCSGGSSGQACSNGAAHLPPGELVNLINPVVVTLDPASTQSPMPP